MYTNNIDLILFLLKNVTGSNISEIIIDLNGFTSNYVSVSNTNDILDLGGSCNEGNSQKSFEEVSIHHNDSKIKKYIYSICINIILSWGPKLLLDVCILPQKMQRLQHYQTYQ